MQVLRIDAGCRSRVAGYEVRVVGRGSLYGGYLMLDPGCSMLENRCWMLDVDGGSSAADDRRTVKIAAAGT